MKNNVGGIDRLLRFVVGLALMVAAATGGLGAWAWIGVVPLATSMFGFCPAYLPLGFSSRLKTFR